jgi:N-acyl-L-homoserine lactone synthetase
MMAENKLLDYPVQVLHRLRHVVYVKRSDWLTTDTQLHTVYGQ